VNITFQRLAPYETKENVVIKAYFKGKINIYNVSYNKTINDFQFDGYQDVLTQELYIYLGHLASVNIMFLG